MVVRQMNSLNYDKIERFFTPDGMEVILLYDKSHSTYVQLDINFGSFDLGYIDDEQRLIEFSPGIAHFLEHKIFAMDDETDAFSYLTELGLQANAMTSYLQTSYVLTGSQNIEEGLSYLLKMLDTPYFTEENVEQEFNIISEELRMYQDDIDSEIQLKILNMMTDTHPIKHDIGGRIEDVEVIDEEMLKSAYNAYYHPSNRKLMISGPIDFKQMKELILESSSSFEKVDIKALTYTEEKHVVKSSDEILLDIIKPKLVLGLKFEPKKDLKERFKQEIISVIAFNYLYGSLSTFYEKGIDDAIITEPVNYQLINERDIFYVILQSESYDLYALNDLMTEPLYQKDFSDFTEELLDLIKRIMIGQQIFSLNEFDMKLLLFSKYDEYGVSFDDVIDEIKSITQKEVISFIKEFSKQKTATLFVKPKDENEDFLI